MALTQLQAREMYLVDSMVQFISRSTKAAYDTEVAASQGTAVDFSQKLRVRVGKPDDRDLVLNPPVIAVDPEVSSERDNGFEIGTTKAWRHYTFVLYCYPAITADGGPCLQASDVMKAYMRNCFGEFIRVIDYSGTSTPSAITFCTDGMYIVNVTDPMDRGKQTTLAQERHRFDMHVTVKVPVIEVLST